MFPEDRTTLSFKEGDIKQASFLSLIGQFLRLKNWEISQHKRQHGVEIQHGQ